jgi:hypothetical protein
VVDNYATHKHPKVLEQLAPRAVGVTADVREQGYRPSICGSGRVRYPTFSKGPPANGTCRCLGLLASAARTARTRTASQLR